MEIEFKVIVGHDSFYIVDGHGSAFGSYASREDADKYCERLNEKWARGGRS